MQDLTIVLTLYDRGGFYEYPKRWMEFAKKHLSMFKILVADGSGKKEIKSYFTDKKNFKNIDLLYLEYPKDNTYRDYFAKLNDSINKVDTKYTILADDDDFYYSEGLIKSIEFLDNNNDFVTCRGLIGSFKLSNSKKLKIKYINIPKGGPSLDNPNPIERYKFSFKSINPIYYDVHRSELQKYNFKLLDEPNFIEPIMVEMLPQTLDVIQGKIGRINEFFLMRQIDQNNSAHKQYVDKSGDVLHRLCFGDFSNDLKIWADILSKDLSKICNIDEKTSYEIVISVFKESLMETLERINEFKKNKNIKKNINNFINFNNGKRLIRFFKKKIFSNNLNDNDEKIIFNNEFLSQINNHLKEF